MSKLTNSVDSVSIITINRSNMDIQKKTLRNFGLSEKEIAVYLETLKHEELSPFKISQLTKIPRTTVYDVLMSLSLKGLIRLEQSTGFEKQQTRVRAKNPSVLRKIINEKRAELSDLELDVVSILSDLKQDYHGRESNADFQFYPGIEGARKLVADYDDVNIPRSSWTYLMEMDAIGRELTNKSVADVIELNNKNNTLDRELVPFNDWTRHVISYQLSVNPGYLDYKQMRYIDKPGFELYTRLEIQGNYVRMICTNKDEVWGMKIRSTAMSKSFQSIYDLLWSEAKIITKEMVLSWGPNEYFLTEKKKKSKK